MAKDEAREGRGGDVVLLVCIECGREEQFEGGEEPPSELTCEKCGNQVFRRFEDSAAPDEARAEFRESTERDLATDDPAGDATTGDLLDLDTP